MKEIFLRLLADKPSIAMLVVTGCTVFIGIQLIFAGTRFGLGKTKVPEKLRVFGLAITALAIGVIVMLFVFQAERASRVPQATITPPSGWCTEHPKASCFPQTCREHRATIVVYGAKWCGYCKQFEENTLANPRVQDRIRTRDYGVVMIDIDENETRGIGSVPTIIFLDRCTPIMRIGGYRGPENFLTLLDQLEEKLPQ